ncbi:MAG TPA: ferredoxin--NADP reductase [Acetobacteraceae bacterium]|nr:ferredoxin--NADP reductase [Acetobacteraceae bacterium]
MSNLYQETVTGVRHWTDKLFSFTATRDPSFRFQSGQFTMIGLQVDGKPLLRAYSMASAHYDEQLEFFSIKAPNGPLTSRLQHLRPGDPILVGRKPVGTLVQDSLTPGRTLYLLATGTGLAPFASIIRDPDVYDRFERIVLVHGCRFVAELGYGQELVASLPENEFIGDLVREKLLFYPTVTREPFDHRGRITYLLESHKLTDDLGLPPLGPEHDRVMLCGSPAFLADMVELLEQSGFAEGSSSKPGQYVIEKAFVEK